MGFVGKIFIFSLISWVIWCALWSLLIYICTPLKIFEVIAWVEKFWDDFFVGFYSTRKQSICSSFLWAKFVDWLLHIVSKYNSSYFCQHFFDDSHENYLSRIIGENHWSCENSWTFFVLGLLNLFMLYRLNVILDFTTNDSLLYFVDNSIELRKFKNYSLWHLDWIFDCLNNLTLTNLDWLVWTSFVQICLGLPVPELAPLDHLVMIPESSRTYSRLKTGPPSTRIGHWEKRLKW